MLCLCYSLAMKMWLRRRWWLTLIILAVALVIWRTEKRCQSQAYQCRAEYLSTLSGIPPNEKAADQEAIAAACEQNSYFCRLFGAANLPNVLLVIAGTIGIWAVVRTLKAIEKQSDAMISSERAWLVAELFLPL